MWPRLPGVTGLWKGVPDHGINITPALDSSWHLDPRPQPEHRAVLDAVGFDTGHAKRDADVRGAKFLDADSHPALTYSAIQATATSGGWSLNGNLVVKRVTAPVELTAEITSADDETASVRAAGVVPGPARLPGSEWTVYSEALLALASQSGTPSEPNADRSL